MGINRRKEVKKLIKEKPGLSQGAYMGLIMGKFKGQVTATHRLNLDGLLGSNHGRHTETGGIRPGVPIRRTPLGSEDQGKTLLSGLARLGAGRGGG